jgi:hypothetical protein
VLLTNATVVDDVIRFVEHSKEKLISKEVVNRDKEFKEDHHYQKLVEEQEEESITTTNEVF